jgi:hypothetical protein
VSFAVLSVDVAQQVSQDFGGERALGVGGFS